MSALERALFTRNTTPEQRYIAGMLANAVDQGERGDAIAREWLKRCAPAYVEAICPPNHDPESLHTALLQLVDQRARRKGREWAQMEMVADD